MNDAVVYDPQRHERRRHARDLHRARRSRGIQPAAKPEVPTVYLKSGWRSAAVAAFAAVIGTALAFSGRR